MFLLAIGRGENRIDALRVFGLVEPPCTLSWLSAAVLGTRRSAHIQNKSRKLTQDELGGGFLVDGPLFGTDGGLQGGIKRLQVYAGRYYLGSLWFRCGRRNSEGLQNGRRNVDRRPAQGGGIYVGHFCERSQRMIYGGWRLGRVGLGNIAMRETAAQDWSRPAVARHHNASQMPRAAGKSVTNRRIVWRDAMRS